LTKPYQVYPGFLFVFAAVICALSISSAGDSVVGGVLGVIVSVVFDSVAITVDSSGERLSYRGTVLPLFGS